MSLHRQFRRRLTQSCTIKTHTGYNAQGDAQYSTSPTTYPCLVFQDSIWVDGRQGPELIQQNMVVVGPTSTGGEWGGSVQDEITLPDGTIPRLRKVDRNTGLRNLGLIQVAHFG